MLNNYRINNFLNFIKNFLLISSVFLFCILIFTKYKIFQLKKNIRNIESDIILLEKEKEILNLEIVYLTNPERLKKIYSKIKKMNIKTFNNKELISVNQIKDIKNLIPYYYTKLEKYNNSMALK